MIPAVVVFNALITGATIFLMASGLVLVFSVMGIMNWAHGQLYMLGAFGVYILFAQLGLNYLVSLIVVALIVAFLGILIERYCLRPLTSKGMLAPTALALGLIFIFEGIAMTLFGKDDKAVPSVLKGVVHLGEVALSKERLAILGMAVFLAIGLYIFINKTRTGLGIRAAAENPMVAQLYGVQSGRLFTVVMGIGCGLAALSGGMIAPIYTVNPWIGTKPLIMALAAIVLGGLGSFRGAFVGGILLGLVSSVGSYYIGPWSELLVFLIVVIILLSRPQGLFGQPLARV